MKGKGVSLVITLGSVCFLDQLVQYHRIIFNLTPVSTYLRLTYIHERIQNVLKMERQSPQCETRDTGDKMPHPRAPSLSAGNTRQDCISSQKYYALYQV